jgi:LacI family repressor for deo operon, udp, cdd, tsx, nupC, and nupG
MRQDNQTTKILDVARIAGVSTATVSRVIHNNGRVNEDTRLRVEEAVARLGYQSRREPKKDTLERVVLLLSGDVVNPFFAEVIRGVQTEMDLQRSMLNIAQISTDHTQLMRTVSQMSPLGVILTGAAPFPELLAWREESQTPLVVVNYRCIQPGVSCILVDFKDTYSRATRHLINLGHRRIGYVGISGASEITQARLQGYEAALVEANIPFRPELCITMSSESHIHGGFQAASNFLALPADERPTAVLSYNDFFAMGIMHAVRVHGLRVPEDVSVIGCDDIPMAAYANPPLTTIGLPKYRIGKLAVSMLLQMLQDSPEQVGNFTLMESPLVIRESTGPNTRD